jgi:hypothetical protein
MFQLLASNVPRNSITALKIMPLQLEGFGRRFVSALRQFSSLRRQSSIISANSR